ncbi:MAG: hypothetical protein PHG35_02105 [Dehalococcoidales bacterium]|nr:hypothetical protein [Dehalococcoidales bacterium]
MEVRSENLRHPLCQEFLVCERLTKIQKSHPQWDAKAIIREINKACAKCTDYKPGRI